jgi:hypothetical protein
MAWVSQSETFASLVMPETLDPGILKTIVP